VGAYPTGQIDPIGVSQLRNLGAPLTAQTGGSVRLTKLELPHGV
jgi:hypothetical protein